MLTVDKILLILSTDDWFIPSKSEDKITIKNDKGELLEVPKSYYHTFTDGEQIVIRVSQHGTSLNTWVKRRVDPSQSLQNLSVIFSDEPVTSTIKTEPRDFIDKYGHTVKKNIYFVVEQYVYRISQIEKSDFVKIIKRIKAISNNNVFTDPLKNKPSKLAKRTVLQPQDIDGNNIPNSNNKVHSRQTIVAANKEKEVDVNGNILSETINIKELIKIIEESIKRNIINI